MSSFNLIYYGKAKDFDAWLQKLIVEYKTVHQLAEVSPMSLIMRNLTIPIASIELNEDMSAQEILDSITKMEDL